MKTLVIGAGGFLGAFIVRELHTQGHEVVVVDFKPEVTGLPEGVEYLQGDVTDRAGLEAVLQRQRPETVINLAGVLTEACARIPFQAMSVNVMGMANVLEASRLHGVRRVVVSSSAGVCSPDRVDTREERLVSPQLSMYGATKFMCEILGREYRKNYGLEVVCLRFSLIYGPGEVATAGNAMRLKNIESCITGKNITIGDAYATDRVHLLHVSDAAQATVQAATAPNALQLVYNISGMPADFLSFQEIVDILHQVCLGAGQVCFMGSGAPVEYGMYLHDKARRDFGFKPAYTAERGLRENASIALQR